VRRLVFDTLTKAQQRQLRTIGRRVVRAIDSDEPCLDEQPFRTALDRDRTSAGKGVRRRPDGVETPSPTPGDEQQ
jgi:hypothetical protein